MQYQVQQSGRERRVTVCAKDSAQSIVSGQ